MCTIIIMHVYNTCTCVYSCIYWRSEHIHVRTCMHMICMYEHMIKIYCRMQLTDRSSRPELSYQLEVCDILYTSLYIARALYAAHGVCMVHVHVRIFYASIHIHVHMYVGLYVFVIYMYMYVQYIQYYTSFNTAEGVGCLDIQLSDEPNLGSWSASANILFVSQGPGGGGGTLWMLYLVSLATPSLAERGSGQVLTHAWAYSTQQCAIT